MNTKFVEETLKSIMLRPATKCEMAFDIGKIQTACAQAGLNLKPETIKSMVSLYCHQLKKKNSRVVAYKIKEDPSSEGVLLATFTVRLFDIDSLPKIDKEFARKVVVSEGEWRWASGQPDDSK